MSCFIATLKIKPGHEADFEKLQAELSQLTHAQEPDTLVYDILRSRTARDTYVVYARFRNEAAFQLPGHAVSRAARAADHGDARR